MKGNSVCGNWLQQLIKVKNMGCGNVSEGRVSMPAPLNSIYERQELIGSGTFGKVYKCLNHLNGLTYALKAVDITANTREEAVKQIDSLKREIKVLKKLNHPNIVKYYSFDISPDGQQVEIVLEYAQRGSLKSYFGESGPLGETETAEKTRQILEGLAYLHQQNIMHRDLKCANILVMGDETLKITDFGTAKLLSSPRTSGHPTKSRSKSMENISANPSLKGTPYYMAPEVLRRTGHGLSADIWSLGCLIIEMLTAKAPWTSLTSDFQEIIGYILSGIHPPHPKGLTDDCEHFLTSCLQHVPSQRPTCLQLLKHKWITRPHEDMMPLYKNSLSKTNDDYYQEIFEDKVPRGGKKALRDQKMREIDNYLFEKTKTRQKKREKQGKRESAKPKRERTANLIYSEEQIGFPQEAIQVLDYRKESQPQPLARKLFEDESNQPNNRTKISNALTAPQIKMPETLISEIKELHQQDCQIEVNDYLRSANQVNEGTPLGTRIVKTEQKPKEGMIDTVISRDERTRFLQQQRLLRQQREEEKRKWEQQLQQGAHYLRKEINSRYVS